jgi:hypothetical protein
MKRELVGLPKQINLFVRASWIAVCGSLLVLGLNDLLLKNDFVMGCIDLFFLAVWTTWWWSTSGSIAVVDKRLLDLDCLRLGLESELTDIEHKFTETMLDNIQYKKQLNEAESYHRDVMSPLTDPECYTQAECQLAQWVDGRAQAELIQATMYGPDTIIQLIPQDDIDELNRRCRELHASVPMHVRGNDAFYATLGPAGYDKRYEAALRGHRGEVVVTKPTPPPSTLRKESDVSWHGKWTAK